MDRETLIEKIKKVSSFTNEDLSKLSDEDLMHLYNDLEDSGEICDYSD